VGSAVVRNRTRRRLREIIRALPIAHGYDIVVTGHPASATASYGALAEAISSSAKRARILINTNQT
jgi:ribonuclease P protein component